MSHFASNFDRLLGLHRLTSEQAAELLGVSKTTISNWRTGVKEPSLSNVVKLVEVFGIDPVAFVQQPFADQLENMLDRDRFVSVEDRAQAVVDLLSAMREDVGADSEKVVPLKKGGRAG